MKTWLKILIILAIVGLIAAFVVWKFVINKPQPNYAKEKAEVEVLASDLFDQFTGNKAAATPKFTGKMIQLKGKFSKTELNGAIGTVIFVFRQGEFGDEGIRCILLPDQNDKIKTLKSNQEVTLKGYCTGYNDADVIVEKCVFVE